VDRAQPAPNPNPKPNLTLTPTLTLTLTPTPTPTPTPTRGVAPEALLSGYLEAISAREDHAIDESRPPAHLRHLFSSELGDADLTAEDVRTYPHPCPCPYP
jgi:hypothetical protein